MSTIVLAHGIFGFAKLIPGFSLITYFNGVEAHLSRQGHDVIVPAVKPIGSIESRATELVQLVLSDPKASARMHIIAHSMGGLDARQALATNTDFRRRIATLVTIGTPHLGSKVANVVVKAAGRIRLPIPGSLGSFLHDNAGAFGELTTDFCASFNERTKTAEAMGGIRYIEVAGDKSKTDSGFGFFRIAAEIGGIDNEVNDGVVAKSSALRNLKDHEHLDDWPVDHVGEIGWSKDSLKPIDENASTKLLPSAQQHLARYDDIVSRL
ncbi:MAG TPA: hypothetical protein VIB39_10320 [Candidatus Angelobacter sp.]|jgi:triacylglycerol lipase